MVGVINPNDTQTLHEQVLAAASADYQLAPGDPVPNEASSSITSPPAASSPVEPASANQSSSVLSTAAIAGITVGAIVFLALCAGLSFHFARRARAGRQKAAEEPPLTPFSQSSPNMYSPISPMANPQFGPFQFHR
jgi:hypothetical protein